MLLLTIRAGLVALALSVPMFMQGGNLVFVPVFQLYNWGADALYFHNAEVSPGFQRWATAAALLVVVPVLVALWFRLLDVARFDIATIRPRSRIGLNLLLAGFSCFALMFAMLLSDANEGPIMIWSGDMFSRSSPLPTLFSTAVVLVCIEQTTYWLSRRK